MASVAVYGTLRGFVFSGCLRQMGSFGAGRAGKPATAGARTLGWLPRLARAAATLLVSGSLAAAAHAADPAKVLRIAFPAAETGFDPVRVSDGYSNTVN